ncbi:DNA sulfur modification protein DndD [Dysgonomonas sp. 25]|uniref:DNA sulfur modification protein DndD n=1 Tax=Dysgonomonas sp. 25 TaxID=2302933 RepID=UPI0013D7E993|nr:DNA sulfur modification protein DndD [Dysgonomonas sp. 25]NDV70384.1 DNA sulfur modification protein DndD [Dysgonomonas sp. 25]
MYIKEIELNNFRIYKGNNVISLLPSDNKNVIVISGKNGFGKTTFLMSLVWCLYGKQMEKVDDLYEKEIRDKGNYTKYISESLNRKAREEGENEFSVSVTFCDVKIPDITCSEVTIKRTYNVITSASDKIEVLVDGYPNQLVDDFSKNNQQGEEIFIRDFILPIEIAKFFFFDAEKIVSLAEVNSTLQRQQLSKAYSEVLGIQKYEDLKSNLEEKQDDYRRRSAKPEEKRELNQLHADIENTEITIKDYGSQIDDIKEKRNTLEKESDEIQRKLIREGDKMSLEELNELKNEQSNLNQEIAKKQENLRELLDVVPFALAGETMANVLEQINDERALAEQKYKQEDVSEKIDKIQADIENAKLKSDICFDTNTVKVKNFYEEQIKILIKKYFFSDIVELPDTFKVLHDFSSTQTNEFTQLVNTIRLSFKDKFSQLNSEYSFIKNQLDSINRKLRDAENKAEDEYISSLRQKKDAITSNIIRYDNEIEALNQKVGSCTTQLQTLLQRQGVLRKKIDESSVYSKKEKKTKQLIIRLQNFIVQFKDEKKKSLEAKMLESLNILLHKKEFIKRVDVDINATGDDIDIVLYNQNNKIIDRSSLSMGERQMYASALLSSLVDESEIEFPVFIDSPMQKFDEQHAENIIKYFYPSVSKQVVIFPLINKELTEKEYEILEPKVSRAYLIENISTDSSKFTETTPDKFIETYNQKYNAN